MEVRLNAIRYMREHPDEYQNVLPGGGLEQYCLRMERQHEYAESEVINATCRAYNINLYVHTDEGGGDTYAVVHPAPDEHTFQINVVYKGRALHYQVAELLQDQDERDERGGLRGFQGGLREFQPTAPASPGGLQRQVSSRTVDVFEALGGLERRLEEFEIFAAQVGSQLSHLTPEQLRSCQRELAQRISDFDRFDDDRDKLNTDLGTREATAEVKTRRKDLALKSEECYQFMNQLHGQVSQRVMAFDQAAPSPNIQTGTTPPHFSFLSRPTQPAPPATPAPSSILKNYKLKAGVSPGTPDSAAIYPPPVPLRSPNYSGGAATPVTHASASSNYSNSGGTGYHNGYRRLSPLPPGEYFGSPISYSSPLKPPGPIFRPPPSSTPVNQPLFTALVLTLVAAYVLLHTLSTPPTFMSNLVRSLSFLTMLLGLILIYLTVTSKGKSVKEALGSAAGRGYFSEEANKKKN
jgi:hypothetical protein